MIDLFGLPEPGVSNIQTFTAQGTNANGTWQQWVKPPGVNMVYMYAIGGGGGGGGGFTRASGAAGGGGSGGGAATASLLIPAFFVPGVLYVQPGIGGAGSTGSGVAGSAGGHSYISIGAYPVGTLASMITHSQIYLHSGLLATPAGGGGAGTVAAGGAAGVAGAIPTAALNTLGSPFGFWKATVGGVGVAGGFSVVGNPNGVLNASVAASGGGSGGGANAANTAGGAIIGTGFFQTIAAAAAGSSGIGGSGFTQWGRSAGGAGGDGSAAGVGGHGGNGGIGAGGGGGGSGTVGGRGGKGGDGMVVIISW